MEIRRLLPYPAVIVATAAATVMAAVFGLSAPAAYVLIGLIAVPAIVAAVAISEQPEWARARLRIGRRPVRRMGPAADRPELAEALQAALHQRLTAYTQGSRVSESEAIAVFLSMTRGYLQAVRGIDAQLAVVKADAATVRDAGRGQELEFLEHTWVVVGIAMTDGFEQDLETQVWAVTRIAEDLSLVAFTSEALSPSDTQLLDLTAESIASFRSAVSRRPRFSRRSG